jgi:hypothetical protein
MPIPEFALSGPKLISYDVTAPTIAHTNAVTFRNIGQTTLHKEGNYLN